MPRGFELDSPERVTIGTVGAVGERTFFLQARQGTQLLTVKVEKQQVAALSAYLGRLLRELERPGELPKGSELELEEFVEPSFVVRALGITYDSSIDRVLLVADEMARSEDDEENAELILAVTEEKGSAARLTMTRAQAAALAIRGTELVQSGRPPCPLCGYPLDPRGHVCPRTNGHTPPLT